MTRKWFIVEGDEGCAAVWARDEAEALYTAETVGGRQRFWHRTSVAYPTTFDDHFPHVLLCVTPDRLVSPEREPVGEIHVARDPVPPSPAVQRVVDEVTGLAEIETATIKAKHR